MGDSYAVLVNSYRDCRLWNEQDGSMTELMNEWWMSEDGVALRLVCVDSGGELVGRMESQWAQLTEVAGCRGFSPYV